MTAVRVCSPIRVAIAVCCAVGAAVAVPHAAGAEPRLDLSVGAKGRFRPGHPVPVRATVTADHELHGHVRVAIDDDEIYGSVPLAPSEVAVDLSAGETKSFTIVVPGVNRPPYAGTQQQFRAGVELWSDGARSASNTALATTEESVESVGVLGSLGTGRLPGHVPLRVTTTGTAELVTIDPVELDAGPGALGPVGAVVTAPADLAALAPRARDALVHWIAAGGELWVDSTSAPVPALPDTWQPTGGWALAGDGLVRLSHGRAAAGEWSSFLEPTRASGRSMGIMYASAGTSTLAPTLGADAGVRIPEIGVLVAAAAVYVLLVGPVMFLVLARLRRRTLAWVTIPAMATLFTGAYTIAGSRARAEVTNAHATIIEHSDGGGSFSWSVALVGSSPGGAFELQAPDGWTPAPADQREYQRRARPTAMRIGSPTRFELGPGEFRQVGAAGPAPGFAAGLRVRASSDDRIITGTVTNDLDVPLHQVTVMAHRQTTVIGTVAAHGSAPFSMSDAPAEGTPPPFGAQWGDERPELSEWTGGGFDASPRGQAADDRVSAAMWNVYLESRPQPLRSGGSVNVVGWTRELRSPLTVNGAAVTRGRTGVVARARIESQAGVLAGARFELVRPVAGKAGEGEPGAEPIERFVIGPAFRLVLPPGVDPASVVIDVPPRYHRIGVSSRRGWKVTPEQAAPLKVRLTADDVVGGAVYVMVRIPDDMSGSQTMPTDPYLGWAFHTAGSREETTPAEPASEVSG